MTTEELSGLTQAIFELKVEIEKMSERQEQMVDDVKKAMEGLLAPEEIEKVVGRAEVREVFTIPKVGAIAGCHVLSGKAERNLEARLIRDNVVVYQGKIASIRRFKEDVKEVTFN